MNVKSTAMLQWNFQNGMNFFFQNYVHSICIDVVMTLISPCYYTGNKGETDWVARDLQVQRRYCVCVSNE